MPENDRFYDINFIYHPADIEKTRRIAAQLSATDVDAFFNEEEFGETAEGVKRLKDAILRSYAAAFVMSPDSAESQLCNELLQYAVGNGKRLVTLILNDDIEVEIHPAIAQNPYVFFRESDDLVARVNELRAYLRADYHLKLHTELLVLAERWRERGRASDLLLPPDRLDEARRWLGSAAARQPKPSPLQLEYVHSSRRQPPRRGRTRSRRVAVGVVAAAALALCLLLLQWAVSGWQAGQVADAMAGESRTRIALDAAEASAASEGAIGLIDNVAATSAGLRKALVETATAEAIARTAARQATQTAIAEAEMRAAQLRATEIAELERDEVGKRLVQAGEDALESGDSELALALAWAAKERLDEPGAAHRLMRRAASSGRSMTIDDVALLAVHPAGAAFAIAPGGGDSLHIYAGDTWARQAEWADHDAPISVIAYDSAGDHLISASNDGEIVIRAGDTGESERRLAGHRGAVAALALSADGKRLFSAGGEPVLVAWNLDTGEEIAALAADDAGLTIRELVVSADGSRVIGFFGEDNRRMMRQWSAETLESLDAESGGRVYRGVDARSGIGYSGGSSLPAYPGDSNTGDLILWDLSTGAQLVRLADGFNWRFLSGDSLAAGSDDLLFVAFADDIALLVVNNSLSGQVAALVEIAEGSLLRRFTGEIAAQITSAEFIDRETILSATSDNRALLWSSQDGGLIRELGRAPQAILQLEANAAANLAIARAADGAVHLWTFKRAASEPLLTLNEAQPGAALSPSGAAILVVEDDRVSLRAVDTGEALVRLPASRVARADAYFVGAHEGRIAVYDMESGAGIRHWAWTDDAATDIYLAPDGETLLVFSRSNELWLARGADDAPVRLADQLARPSLVRFAPGGGRFLTIHDELALLWDGEAGLARAAFPLGFAGSAEVEATFSADGESALFFVRLDDGLAGLTRIDLADNSARRQTFVGVRTAALSADGETLSLATGDGRVQVLSTDNGARIHDFRADAGDAKELLYLPQTETLVGAVGSQLLLWDAAVGAVDQRFAHGAPLTDFSLSHDGRRVLTVDERGVLRLWQIESAAELLARVEREHNPRELTCGERERYLVAPLCE